MNQSAYTSGAIELRNRVRAATGENQPPVLSSLLQVLVVLRKNAADKTRVWNCAGENSSLIPAHIVDAHQEKMELLEVWNGWNKLRDLSTGGFLGLNRQES
jgi:hypothetical protein